MKVVLSRKGLDSSYGGRPNAIMPDNAMLAFPIPSLDDRTRYNDLSFQGWSVDELLAEISPHNRIRYRDNWHEITSETRCHLDPDIRPELRPRPAGWRASYGQVGASQSHLDNLGVGEGDLFLFFGWFKRTKEWNGVVKYVRGAPELHVIYGFLEVEYVVRDAGQLQPWMEDHPHYSLIGGDTNDTIYVARSKLSLDASMPGAGPLPCSEKRVLTKTNHSRSKWLLPSYLRDTPITYHSDESWKDGYFQSAAIGQEFVIAESKEAEQFARSILLS